MSVGCAPTLSQCRARSTLTLIVAGSVIGIVVADGFYEGAIAGRAAVGGDDTVAGPLLGAHPPQAKFDHAELLPLLIRVKAGIEIIMSAPAWWR